MTRRLLSPEQEATRSLNSGGEETQRNMSSARGNFPTYHMWTPAIALGAAWNATSTTSLSNTLVYSTVLNEVYYRHLYSLTYWRSYLDTFPWTVTLVLRTNDGSQSRSVNTGSQPTERFIIWNWDHGVTPYDNAWKQAVVELRVTANATVPAQFDGWVYGSLIQIPQTAPTHHTTNGWT